MAISNELREGLNLLVSGDELKKEEGFHILYRNTYQEVYKKALYIMKNESDAQDLAQDSFMQAYNHIDSLQNAEYIHAWLGGIVHNLGMNIYRKRRKEFLVDEESEGIFEAQISTDASAMPGTREEREATAKVVMSFIDELPELQRGAVLAFYYENMKIDDIARVYDCSPNTIKSRLNYAKKAIKDMAEAHEKKYQYKLCSLSPAIIFLAFRYLFATQRYASFALSGTTSAIGVKAFAKTSLSGATGSTGATGATGATLKGTAMGAVSKAGLGVGAKIAIAVGAVVVAGGVTAGGIAIANSLGSDKNETSKYESNKDYKDDVDEPVPDTSTEGEIVLPADTATMTWLAEGAIRAAGCHENSYGISVNEELEECYVYFNNDQITLDGWLFEGGFVLSDEDYEYLVVCFSWYNGYPTTYVYTLDLATNTLTLTDEQNICIADDVNNNGTNEVVNLYCWERMDNLGTYAGYKYYSVENGKLVTSDTIYEYHVEQYSSDWTLEVKTPFDATVNGQVTTLPVGAKLTPTGYGDDGTFYFTYEGQEGSVLVEGSWPFLIDGVDANELFVQLPYAG